MATKEAGREIGTGLSLGSGGQATIDTLRGPDVAYRTDKKRFT